ncbi:MAG: hypothetical protein C5B58_11800 [Acidobacteria bacterium]|nr:MAG: hypothetical protein C5B58_11800 [Acidobacteriota bacterium]
MAKASRDPARKLVYLEVAIAALRRLGLGEESIRRSIFQGCDGGGLFYTHTGPPPPPGFWRNWRNASFDGSSIKNIGADVTWFVLSDVQLDWNWIAAKHPGAELLGLGVIPITFAAPLMQWLAKTFAAPLMQGLAKLWRLLAPKKSGAMPEVGAQRQRRKEKKTAAMLDQLREGGLAVDEISSNRLRDELRARGFKTSPDTIDRILGRRRR